MYVYSKQFVDRLRPETGAFRLCPRFGYREIAYGVLPAEQSYVHRVSGAYQIQKWPTHPNNNPLVPPGVVAMSCHFMSFHVPLLWGPEKRATQVSGAPSETTRGEVLADFAEKPEKCLTCWIHILRSGPSLAKYPSFIAGSQVALHVSLHRHFLQVNSLKFTVLVGHMPMAVDLWFSQPRRIEKTWTVRNMVNPQL